MKRKSILVMTALAAGCCWASFGPLTPSAKPYERTYIWPDGKMPDVQPHQIAAKTGETKRPGFKADDFRRPYIDWYAPNPACKTDLCVMTISGGGFGSCCDAARLQPVIDRFVKAGFTVADVTYRTPRPKGLPIHQSAWEDVQRAVRVVRSQAAKRGFDPKKIGATGISAGSKALLLVATGSLTPAYAPVDEIDNLPCNLLFAIPQAPAYVLTDGNGTPNSRDGDAPDVKLVPELKFDAKTCPMCFFQGGIDEYSPFGTTQIYRQLRRMKIPAEVHLFADRWHGFHGDMNRGDDATGWDHWFHRAEEFIRQLNFDGRLGGEVLLMDRFPDDVARGAYEKEEVWPAGKMPPGYTNQCMPFIEWHFPKEMKTQAVQIIFSGGGYFTNGTAGMEVAPARRYLNAKGMTVVTLRYRTPRPARGLAKHTSAWQDLQRTIRIVRSKAAAKGLDPNRIGIMGGSAGGHLALMGATSSRHKSYLPIDGIDKTPCNVQWAVAVYPAYSLTDGVDCKNTNGGNGDEDRLVPEFSFDLDTCPVLFLHGDADGYSAMASVKVWEQLRRMGVQGEVHTFATRNHCFQQKAAPWTGSYTYLDRIWEFMNHKRYNAPSVATTRCGDGSSTVKRTGSDPYDYKELVAREVLPVKVAPNAAGHVVADFGKDAVGWLELDGPDAGPYEIVIGELLNAKGEVTNEYPKSTIRCQRLEGMKPAGKYRVPMPADGVNLKGYDPKAPAIRLPERFGVVFPFRHAEIVRGPKMVLRQFAVNYPIDMGKSSFHCDCADLERVYEMCKYSILATSFCGVYVDGDRERTPYEADAYINQLCHYAIDNDYSLARKSHEWLMEHPTWPTEWRQHSVMMAWADWMWTGDTRSISKYYRQLADEKLMLKFARASDGLLETGGERRKGAKPGASDIVDWPESERDGFVFRPVNAVVNAFFYRNLREMSDISKALGKADRAAAFADKARKVRESFQKAFYRPETGLYADGEGTDHCSLHANVAALAFGLVPKDRVAAIADFIERKGMVCSVYFSQYLLEALFEAGRAEAAIRLMTSHGDRSWIGMMDFGSTVSMEAWNVAAKPNLDLNHAWGSTPLNVIARYVIGVTPLEPGFQKIAIRPQLGGLKSLSATVPTAAGPVTVKVDKGVLEFTSPSPSEVTFAGKTCSFPAGRHKCE